MSNPCPEHTAKVQSILAAHAIDIAKPADEGSHTLGRLVSAIWVGRHQRDSFGGRKLRVAIDKPSLDLSNLTVPHWRRARASAHSIGLCPS